MKHLPNLLTLGNLFCGCVAIAFILNAQPYVASFNGSEYWVTGTEQAYWGSIFIGIAAVLDVLDGLVARALKIFSPIGADLDSLADVVSFGVAPSMIMFKMLWASYMSDPEALDVAMVAMSPAFLIACFGALRLARFNVYSASSTSFKGMPIPAVGITIASFPLINWYTPAVGIFLHKAWVLYLLIGLLSWLMVSRITFFKLLPSKLNLAGTWKQLVMVVTAAVTFPLLGFVAIPAVLLVYIVLSLVASTE